MSVQNRLLLHSKAMSGGEILTAVTIWITLVAYATGSAIFALSRARRRWDSSARLIWTLACVALLAHVASAFHFYHQWSHGAAYRDTARQTYEMFGVKLGAGLYLNYALLIIWIVDVLWWWIGGLDAYPRRTWLLVAAWHGFLVFVFKATVVWGGFVPGWDLRVFGLCLVWWRALRRVKRAT